MAWTCRWGRWRSSTPTTCGSGSRSAPVRRTCSSCSACPTPRRCAGSGSSAGRVPAAIFVKEPSAAAVKRAVALGIAVVAVEPQARWELLYKLVNHAFEHHGDRGDPLLRLRHRPVRPRAIHRRPHPRHDQHRGRGVPRAGVLGVQRRGRRAASPDDSGARRPARTPGVDRPVGHLRRACAPAATSSASPSARSWGCDRGWRPASICRRPMRAAGPVSPERSGCSRDRRRWPTTSRRSCAAARCWRPASCRGWRPRRRRTPCECRNCSVWSGDDVGRRRDRPRAGHHGRRARRADRVRRRRDLGTGRRDCVERQRISGRRPDRVDGRAGIRAAAQDRRRRRR